jgi:hypothetical protein
MTKYLVVLLVLLMISLSILFREELFELSNNIMMNPSRFEEQIREFETNDNPPEKGAIYWQFQSQRLENA